MATTSIWAVKGNAAAIRRVELYVEHPQKTACTADYLEAQAKLHQTWDGTQFHPQYEPDRLKQEQCRFVSGVNCNPPDDAWREFAYAYAAWGKSCRGRVCYHGYQSFKKDEVSAADAHAIGVELAETLWGDRFQVVVATHLDKESHLHNHFVLNAISFADGRKYDNSKSDYRMMRRLSDEICRTHGLSVIEQPKKGQAVRYGEWYAQRQGGPTARGDIRKDMDAVIARSDTMDVFIRRMEALGYQWNLQGKYPKIMPPGRDRFFRLYKLGEGYDSLETIGRRILELGAAPKEQKPQITRQVVRGRYVSRKKATGMRALYSYYCYRLGVFHKRHNLQNVPMTREAAKQIREISGIAAFLHSAGIRTTADLKQYQDTLQKNLRRCTHFIARQNQQLAQSRDPLENEACIRRMEHAKKQLRVMQQQQRYCKLAAARQKQPEDPGQKQTELEI